MARIASPVGPSLMGLIEDAPVALAKEVILHRESDTGPVFDMPSCPSSEHGDEQRDQFVKVLGGFGRDELQPLEERCRRIHQMAEGKGVVSLGTIVMQQMMDEPLAIYESQLDALCRSIWIFLHHRSVFEDAESFHFARRYRDHGKLYDAFEVDIEQTVAVDATSVDAHALVERIMEVLELKTNCTVRALDLPAAGTYPRSIMLIVRHGGPLSSVFNHRDDGHRRAIYYRPPNEAALIHTPALRLIEICADSPVVRQKVARAFAEVTLGQDMSRKPLTWKRYNLSRFRTSLRLPLPTVDGYEIHDVRVLEAEIRLGTWSRKLSLKVGKADDIEEIAARYLKPNNILQRADSFSRISVAVTYNQIGDERTRTLNIIIAGARVAICRATRIQRSVAWVMHCSMHGES